MKSEKNTLYIKGGRNTEVTAPDVTLGDILSMECTDKLMLAKIRTRKILRFPKKKKGRRVISVLEIISCIHEEFPDLDVRNLGETDMLITYEEQKTPPRIWHLIKTAFAAAAVFFGAAFSLPECSSSHGTKSLHQLPEVGSTEARKSSASSGVRLLAR